jgi:hypothetical protein
MIRQAGWIWYQFADMQPLETRNISKSETRNDNSDQEIAYDPSGEGVDHRLFREAGFGSRSRPGFGGNGTE